MKVPSSLRRPAMKFVAGLGLVAASYFTVDEFSSPDVRDSGEWIDPYFVAKLDSIRDDVGFPLVINSGVRTTNHNHRVGGKVNSAHTSPCFCAADIRVRNMAERDALIRSARKHGINRIGIGRTFVHLDISKDLPQNVTWYY